MFLGVAVKDSADEFLRVQKAVDAARRRADESAGALKQLMGQLKKEWGVSTLEEAKKRLEEMQSKNEKARRVLNKRVAAFRKKWGTTLDRGDS